MPMINSAVVARGEHLSDKGVMDAVVISNAAGGDSTLSTEVGLLRTADSGLQSELDATQSGAGLSAAGAYSANSSSNYLTAASSLKDADNKLDAQAKVNADAISVESGHVDKMATLTGVAKDSEDLGTFTGSAIPDSSTVKAALQALETGLESEITARGNADSALQSELDATQAGAGLSAAGAYSANSSSNYLTAASSLVDADNKLDAQAKVNADAISVESGHVDKMATLTGVAKDSEDLGTFTGSAIPDSSTVKAALQALETGLETEVSARGTADTALQNELNATQAGAGLAASGAYSADSSSNYIASAGSLAAADTLLDAQIKTNADAITAEATARGNADTALGGRIDNLKAGTEKFTQITITDSSSPSDDYKLTVDGGELKFATA